MVFTRHYTEAKGRKVEIGKKAYKVRKRVAEGKRKRDSRFDPQGQSVCVEELFEFISENNSNMKALREANGTIFRWYRETVSPCGPTLSSTLNLPTNCRFVMEINCAYSAGSTKAQLWKPWCYVARTLRPHVGNNYGLFADRTFCSGETISIYAGRRHSGRQSEYSIMLGGMILDPGGGGVDSGCPIHLGCHMVNDPLNDADKGKESREKKMKLWNAEIQPTGALVATKSIRRNDEIYIDYGDRDK
jgi:hypothetical protein